MFFIFICEEFVLQFGFKHVVTIRVKYCSICLTYFIKHIISQYHSYRKTRLKELKASAVGSKNDPTIPTLLRVTLCFVGGDFGHIVDIKYSGQMI